MRVSFDWLRDLARLQNVTPEQAAESLTMAGFNVDELTVIDRSEIVIGRVLEQEPHPKSRNPLWIHQVDLGGETRQIIAGAPNAVPGSLVPVALPGTTVPSGTFVRDAKIAGVAGRGMLCSAAELLISDDAEGILLLHEGEPGQALESIYPSDAILEVEVTANRPDCLGHLGLARELAAARGRPLGRDFMPLFTGGVDPPATDLISVTIEAPELCPRYIGAVISGVRMGPSPSWMQRRLQAAGVRPINSVVDVTNYVALEYGQPLHVFDLARVPVASRNGGGEARREIHVRRARDGEQLRCLDGETRRLTSEMLVIADAQRPVAIAGVMGGEETGVGESTTDLLLEAANFDGPSIRATSRALRLRTEASARYEKGLSPELALAGARRAATLLAEVAGGTVHLGWDDAYPRPQEPVRVTFRPEKIDAVLGTHVPLEEMEAILGRLEFQSRVHQDGTWDVLPPVYRLDVSLAEDVAEEVGRIHGYDRIPATLPGRRQSTWRPATPGLERRLDAARHELCGAGHTEVIGSALVSGALLERLGLGARSVRVVNPNSEDQDTLRTSLLVTLLQAAALNRQRLRTGLSLFELGRAYLRRADVQTGQPDETERLGLLRMAAADPDAGRDAYLHVKGAFERSVDALALHELAYERAEAVLFHPGRCARVLVDGRPAGHIGELHPSVSELFELEGRVAALEVDVAPLMERARPRRYVPLPRFPAVDRDLAVVVADGLESAALTETIRRAGGELLTDVRAFDEYHGEQVGEGRKSLAFALTFRSPERTLTDEEVDRLLDGVRSVLRSEHGADFRS
jgi:phenylalanyl-tRNA synthetase beta chain